MLEVHSKKIYFVYANFSLRKTVPMNKFILGALCYIQSRPTHRKQFVIFFVFYLIIILHIRLCVLTYDTHNMDQ